MKPEFALDLSHEGIALLQRQPEGTWAGIGKVALDDPDLRRQLRQLRDKALGIAGKGFTTRLIIPNSQILYRDIPAAGPDDDGRRAQIATAMYSTKDRPTTTNVSVFRSMIAPAQSSCTSC